MYKNMDVAVNLFNHAKGSVGIVIDSDLDGACSAAIAYMLCKEYCDRYKPKDGINVKLSWIPTDEYDEQYGDTYKCARCGKEIIGTSNYCPHCGYEYKPWDGTTFK